jgi:hypothetical protein
MNIPIIELLAQICLLGELDLCYFKAVKQKVKLGLYKIFEPCFGNRTAYAIERVIVEAKMEGLVRDDGNCFIAIIEKKESVHVSDIYTTWGLK